MKLNSHETNLLAQEVMAQIKKSATSTPVPAGVLAKVKAYKEKYAKLEVAVKKAESELEEHEMAWEEIIDNVPNVYASDSMQRITQKLKEAKLPTLQQIRDKITLKGLFSKDQDMNKFVSAIVSEFCKKNKAATQLA